MCEYNFSNSKTDYLRVKKKSNTTIYDVKKKGGVKARFLSRVFFLTFFVTE